MAAKKKPKNKDKGKAPAKPKSLTSAEKALADSKAKIDELRKKIDPLKAKAQAEGENSPLWSQVQALQSQLVTAQRGLSLATRQVSSEQKQYAKTLGQAGFEGRAQTLTQKAQSAMNRAQNINQRAATTGLRLQAGEEARKTREIIGGGVLGLQDVIKATLPGAEKTGKDIVGMNLGEIQTSLLGADGQPGLIGLLEKAQNQLAQQTNQAQQREIASIGQGADATRTALQQLSPEVARATNLFNRAATATQRTAEATNPMTRRALEQQSDLSRQAMRQAQNYQDPTKQLAKGAISGYQGLAGLQQMAAEDAYARARQLSPEQMREADQAARESFAARGMLGSTGSVASEILNRESSIAARRAEAAGLGQLAQQGQAGLVGLSSGYESDRLARQQQMRAQAMGLSQSALGAQQSVRGEARQSRGDLYDTGQFYTQYGLPLLTGQTTAQQQGLGLLSAGLGMSGQGSGMLQAGANIGMSQWTTQQEKEAAFRAANAQESSGILGGIGGALGGLFSGAGAAGGFAALFSDIRLKDNLRHIGDIGGFPAFEWDWNENATNPTQPAIGFIAQMVQEKHPELVREIDGYLAIDYAGLFEKLGTSFDELREMANKLKG